MCRPDDLLLWCLFRSLVSLLHVFPCFFQSAERIVVGLQSLAVFVNRALALAGNVENFAELDATPDFGPARVTVAVNGRAVGVGGRLVIALQEENLGNAIARQRAVLVEIECLVEFGQSAGKIPLLLQSLAAQNRRPQLDVA